MASGDKRWREVADRVVAAAGFDLEDFSMVSAGRRRLVRVVVDSDGGVGLDAAAEVSRQLSAAYDDLDAEQGNSAPPYTLEVTSPGVGRPLTEPRHFHRARGRLVSLTRTDGRTELVRVLGVADDALDVLTGGAHGTTAAQIPLDSIVRARVEVEFAAPSAAVAAVLAADPRTAAIIAAASADPVDDPDDGDDPDDPDDADDPDDENEEDEA